MIGERSRETERDKGASQAERKLFSKKINYLKIIIIIERVEGIEEQRSGEGQGSQPG